MRAGGPAAWLLRALLALAPCAALALALPSGAPPGWVWVALAGCSAWWAARPEGPAGVLCLVGAAGWWAWTEPGLPVTVVPAAAVLVLAHLAALVLGYGPPGLRPAPAVLTLWGRRALLLASAALPVWALGRAVLAAGTPPGWVWPLAGLLVTAGGLTAAYAAVGERIEG